MSAIILGIDPGAHGAVAVLAEDGQLLEVVDMPATLEANGRTATNAPLLAGILARTHARIASASSSAPAQQMRRRRRSASAALAG
jgi:hypothetical protein